MVALYNALSIANLDFSELYEAISPALVRPLVLDEEDTTNATLACTSMRNAGCRGHFHSRGLGRGFTRCCSVIGFEKLRRSFGQKFFCDTRLKTS